MSIQQQLSKAIAEAKPTLVEFYSPDCPKCASMEPVIEQVKDKLGDKVNIVQVNVKQYPEIAKQYKIVAHPSWIIFKDGTEAWHDGGEKPYSELVDMLRRFI